MIKKLLIAIVAVCIVKNTFSQNRYIVKFTNKTNTPYTIGNPLAYLSQRAIDRRTNYGIPVDASDLPVDPAYVQQVKSISGVTMLNVSKWFNAVIVDVATPSALTNINALPFVASSSNVGKTKGPDDATVDKFHLYDQGPVKGNNTVARTAGFNYGNALNQTTMININSLHNLGFSGHGMLIAVIDAGFQDADIMNCFDSLFNDGRVLATWDFVSNEINVYDDYWHGASVLATMAANVPGDMVGTAPEAQYILLRSEDASSEYIIEEYNWAVAAEYADSAGADVINSSLGYTEFDDPSQNHIYDDLDGNTCPVTIAADWAASKGIIVVNSAGNSGNSAWQYLGAPADGNNVFAIGAVNSSGQYASFSSQGPSYDGRIKPDVVAQGQGTVLFMPGNPSSTQSSGTSFSGPIIAGSVACLHQRFPAKTNIEIMDAVRQSASQYTMPDAFLGYGIPDFGVASLVLGGYDIDLFDNGLEFIEFFPNPVKSGSELKVSFFSRLKEEVKIEVMDATGKLIYSQAIESSSSVMPFDMDTHLRAGIYFIRAFTSEKSVLRKLIVN